LYEPGTYQYTNTGGKKGTTMKDLLIDMTLIMFTAVILLSQYHVDFTTGTIFLSTLGSLGAILVGLFSWQPDAKDQTKKHRSDD